MLGPPPSSSWLSAHIFWLGPLDELLVQLVLPLAAQSIQQQLATVFFFIRYAEGGLHIRLRLRLVAETGRPRLKAHVRRHVRAFAERGRPGCTAYVPIAGPTVRFVPYRPETERYGNAETMPVAETFFAASSRTVLHWLQAQGPQAAAQRLTTALALHVSFAAACLDRPTAVTWLRQFADDWLPHDPATQLTRTAEKDYWWALFAQRYQACQATLAPAVAQLWQQARYGTPDAPQWDAETAAAARQLHARYVQLLPSEAQRLPIYASLLHLTNNRLGIANHDEAFLAYLLATALDSLTDDND